VDDVASMGSSDPGTDLAHKRHRTRIMKSSFLRDQCGKRIPHNQFHHYVCGNGTLTGFTVIKYRDDAGVFESSGRLCFPSEAFELGCICNVLLVKNFYRYIVADMQPPAAVNGSHPARTD
jgi:hypothetical protein